MATLYLTEPGTIVKKDQDCLLVHTPEHTETGKSTRKVRVPLIKIEQVVVYGTVTLTSPVITALLKQQVDICYCSASGRFLGRLSPELSKNSLIRLAQHRAHNDPARTFALGQAFVRGKLANMRTLLLRANRKRDDPHIAQAAESLQSTLARVDELDARRAEAAPDPARPQRDTVMGTLLGLEGAGTAAYFGVLGRLLPADMRFDGRHRRPPRDPVNALLSFGYVLLMNQVSSAISLVGLDPYVGFLHSSQFGKPALALDIMETFRPLIVDSVVLTLLNNRMLTERDFREQFGAWRLTESGRRTFLTKFEDRLETTIRHPVFAYQATYRRCLELEVRLVSKWLIGELDKFSAFVVR